MNAITRSIRQILQGALKAFQTFPAAIACALAFAIVTMVRIQLEWPEQEAYNFLFNCLHWSFALGAVFSLTAITAAQSRYNQKRAFMIANLLGAAAALVTFLLLYFFGAADPVLEGTRYVRVSALAAARVGVAMFVSFLCFIVLAAYPEEESDFARALFMTEKAFFIALLYGMVIMSGLSGVAGAVQALLYRAMSWKVYAYLGTVTGFLAFTIFLGYFPDFRRGEKDEKREIAQKQPRFIEILFEYIMIPILLALTVVLLLWAARTVISGGMSTNFIQISGIATSYAVAGIWLHLMVTHSQTGLAKFYRLFYPLAALVILAFEAWALLIQLQKYGLKMDEYFFAILWIFALAASILLLLLKQNSHRIIVALACALALLAVLPFAGYHALPVRSQVDRLESLLLSQRMLQDGQIVPAAAEPELAVRQDITDAVTYLANAQDATLPAWFDRELRDGLVFEERFGFAMAHRPPDLQPGQSGYMATILELRNEAIDIRGYQWVVYASQLMKEQASVSIDGVRGKYDLFWTMRGIDGIPTLRIELDDRVILEQDMNDYFDTISQKYPPGQTGIPYQVPLEEMGMQLETPELHVWVIFNHVEINGDPQRDTLNYWIDLNGIYLIEKP